MFLIRKLVFGVIVKLDMLGFLIRIVSIQKMTLWVVCMPRNFIALLLL